MAIKALPTELVALVHHVELNEAGWWDKAIQRFIIAVIWLSKRNLTNKEIACELQKFNVNLSIDRLEKITKKMDSLHLLVKLPRDKYRIGETQLHTMEEEHRKIETIENDAKEKFYLVIKDFYLNSPDKDIWVLFKNNFLIPLVKEIGAKTYSFLSGEDFEICSTNTFSRFLENFPPQIHEEIKTAIIKYLNPQDSNIRTYILQYLSSYFLLASTNLDENTLQKISTSLKDSPEFNIFVDTNFLFSILDLHDNPFNNSCQILVESINAIKNNGTLKINLYVLPETLDEIKAVIGWNQDTIKVSNLTPSMVEAALSNGITGLSRKYFEAYKRVGGNIRPEEYFEPYLNNLIDILGDHGILVWEKNPKDFSKTQPVIDDIMLQYDYEKQKEVKGKSYEQIAHDVLLWHTVKENRKPRVESPIDAKYWVVTIDFGFLGFDKFKNSNKGIPICVHPSVLIQLLQFWISSDFKYDEIMIDSIKWLFLPSTFTDNDEQVTLKILGRLSHFENSQELTPTIIEKILMDKVLRDKFSKEEDIDKQSELVKEAIVVEYKNACATIEEKEKENINLNEKIDKSNKAIDSLQKNYEISQNESLDKQKKIDELEKEINMQKRIENFEKSCLKLALILVSIAFIATYFLSQMLNISYPIILFSSIFFSSLIGIFYISKNNQNDEIINNWKPYKKFMQLKKYLVIILGFVWFITLNIFCNAVGNGIWEYAKKIIGI